MIIKILFVTTIVLTSSFSHSIASPADSFTVPNQITGTQPTTPSTPSPAAVAPVIPRQTPNGVAYDPVASTPPDTNSTGITLQTIFNADHGYVQDSPVRTYLSQLLPPNTATGIACETPTKTGATVYSFHVGNSNVGIQPHDDAFCMNQGCAYFGRDGNERCE